MKVKSSDDNVERLVDPRKESGFIRGTVDQIKRDWNLVPVSENEKKEKCCKKIKFKWVC